VQNPNVSKYERLASLPKLVRYLNKVTNDGFQVRLPPCELACSKGQTVPQRENGLVSHCEWVPWPDRGVRGYYFKQGDTELFLRF
jgi:hypothetical protein